MSNLTTGNSDFIRDQEVRMHNALNYAYCNSYVFCWCSILFSLFCRLFFCIAHGNRIKPKLSNSTCVMFS